MAEDDQKFIEKLKSIQLDVNSEIEDERFEFIRQLDCLIEYRERPLPNLRDIFSPEEIERIIKESINYSRGPVIGFVINSGYTDEPVVDEHGKLSSHRTTAIHHASEHWHFRKNEAIRELFKIYNRYDVNYVDEFGLSHFHLACKYGCKDVAEEFLPLGQDPDCLVEKTGDSALHLALVESDTEMTELLLRNGADPNLSNAEGLTALHVICRSYSDGSVAGLFFDICDDLKLTVEIDATNELGNTPLHEAVGYGSKETIELLLRRGADPNLANAEGQTPLHVMCKMYPELDGELADWFFEVNRDIGQTVRIDPKDALGRTPLQLAVASFLPRVVDVLLKRGADLSSFVFPTESHLDESFDNWALNKFLNRKLRLASGLLAAVECLERRGYELDRRDALKVMKIFAKYEFFQTAMDLNEWFRVDWDFAKEAKRTMIIPSLSLYDLVRLKPEEEDKLLAYTDYLDFTRSPVMWKLFKGHEKDYTLHLCEIMSGGFFRRWALDPFRQLIHNRLPIECCLRVGFESSISKTRKIGYSRIPDSNLNHESTTMSPAPITKAMSQLNLKDAKTNDRSSSSSSCRGAVIPIDEPITKALSKASTIEFELTEQWPSERIKLGYVVDLEASKKRPRDLDNKNFVDSGSGSSSSSSGVDVKSSDKLSDMMDSFGDDCDNDAKQIPADRLSLVFILKFYSGAHEVLHEASRKFLYRVRARALVKEGDNEFHVRFPRELEQLRESSIMNFDRQELLLPASAKPWRVVHVCLEMEREPVGDESTTLRARNARPDLYLSPFCSDVVLTHGDKLIPAHKVILASKSGYFRREFAKDKIEVTCRPTIVILSGVVKLEYVYRMLEFIYAERLDWPECEYDELYCAASKFEVDELKRLCLDRLIFDLTVASATQLYTLAWAFGLETLLATTRKYMEKNEARLVKELDYRTTLIKTLSQDSCLNALRLCAKYPEAMRDEKHEVFEFVARHYDAELRDRLSGSFFAEFPRMAHEMFEFVMRTRLGGGESERSSMIVEPLIEMPDTSSDEQSRKTQITDDSAHAPDKISSNCWRTKLQQCINLARLVVAVVVYIQHDAGEIKISKLNEIKTRKLINQIMPIDGDNHDDDDDDDNAPDVSAIGLHADASNPQQHHEKTDAGDRKKASTKVRTNDWRKRDHRTHMYFISRGTRGEKEKFGRRRRRRSAVRNRARAVLQQAHRYTYVTGRSSGFIYDDYGGGGRERARVVKFAILLRGGFHCLSLPFCLMAHV
ncbi:unnamed protein product [Trichogramma brassicae]|uniref:BTB domain-containing protein n=1 Tax=Trichogramma brassicae TaxID=86971 RepID=A0A6H5J7S8_9HYME|nr:unnamed protein product [Trichogramma brassicae]